MSMTTEVRGLLSTIVIHRNLSPDKWAIYMRLSGDLTNYGKNSHSKSGQKLSYWQAKPCATYKRTASWEFDGEAPDDREPVGNTGFRQG